MNLLIPKITGRGADAFVKEFIPYIEKNFRAISNYHARFITGHSSGGWSCLWLLVKYPDVFQSAWSVAPDPVDFRSFQNINIYNDKNVFWIKGPGQKRMLLRYPGIYKPSYKEISDAEFTLGSGQQLPSFNAVFSKRGNNGNPESLYDRFTGMIDKKVVDDWKKYDINLILSSNIKLAKELTSRIHIYVGMNDEFYYDKSVSLFANTLTALSVKEDIRFFQMKNHSGILQATMKDVIIGIDSAFFVGKRLGKFVN